ncbi:MAG: FAD-dependent oxidoreductase, partial [Caulobacterales bacterium]|nr:FAD-dependent oxidoreductase [Caulobacterales bacterium]
MAVVEWSGEAFAFTADVLIVGAGACGLCAALAARDEGADVIVLEKTKTPLGTTAMSTGLIPAAGTPEQEAAGVADSPAIFARDIQEKARGGADADVVEALAAISADTVAWLRDRHGVPLTLVDGFTYPGHSCRRMYGTPNRTGSELMAALEAAARAGEAEILAEADVRDLIVADGGRVRGAVFERPDGARETIGCEALVVASCGFVGNADLVAAHIPDMTAAVPHTHPANTGAAIAWGAALGAQMADLDAYQGHGGLAAGHGVPILWPTIMAGGFQVNREGRRFSDESKGYSEQARKVLAQTGGVAWTVFDQAIFEIMTQFDDFQDAIAAGALVGADDLDGLAEGARLPAGPLHAAFEEVAAAKRGERADPFGRDFEGVAQLAPPFYAVKVTGALFHTQGGLCVDAEARVLKREGGPFPNLFAGGG